ncbi:hypothetical protein [Bacillus paranthracis]
MKFIIERIEWTYAKSDEQPTMKIKYKQTNHACQWAWFCCM